MKRIYGCVFSITLYFRSEEIHMRLFLIIYSQINRILSPQKFLFLQVMSSFFLKHQIYTVYPVDMVVFCNTKSYK